MAKTTPTKKAPAKKAPAKKKAAAKKAPTVRDEAPAPDPADAMNFPHNLTAPRTPWSW